MNRFTKCCAVLTTATLFTACATNDAHQRAKAGAGIGAVAGAVLGHQVNSKSGRFAGAAIGAIAGATVGDYMDKQQKQLEEDLALEQQQKAIEIERLKDNSLKLSLNNEVSFDFDSAAIKPSFEPSLQKLADVLAQYDRTIVHVVGHTDSTGPDEYNLKLSQRRADAVSAYLVRTNVPASRLRSEGRGESEPRQDNTTDSGRQVNRRVEVLVKPVVEGQEDKAYETPVAAPSSALK